VEAEIKSLQDARIYAGSNDPDALDEQIKKERQEQPQPLAIPPLDPTKPPNGDSQVVG
jgi:hypothetical protein